MSALLLVLLPPSKAVKGVAARIALTEGIDAVARLRWAGWRARRDDEDIAVVAG
jgi:hypothetical protein